MASTGKKFLCKAPAIYNKQPGKLYLTPRNILWTQDGQGQPSLSAPCSKAASLFNSKEGAAQVRMKVAFTDNEKGYNFTFSAPPEVAATQRADFVRELTQIIAKNRSAQQSDTPSSVPGTPGTPVAGPSNLRAPAAASRAGLNADFQLRRKILLKNPELAALHAELVIGAQITEAEFWEGREQLLSAEKAAEAQHRGKANQLVDPRPTTGENGEIKIIITPQLVHDVFEEWPIVARAYHENVPNEMSEGSFWQRYFQSKLFSRNQASTRTSATQHVVKDDPIFDQYLELEDDQLEPLHPVTENVDMLLDLAATEEDHGETGNERDLTMQAGKERGILPLIRRFNVHSERLLNSALGDNPSKRRRLEGDGVEARFDPNEYYAQIDLEDLHDPVSSTGAVLDIQDRQRYFEGGSTGILNGAAGSIRSVEESEGLLEDFKNQTKDWETTIGNVKMNRKAADAAFTDMSATVKAKLNTRHHYSEIPDSFFRQMTTCQTAANEFLRQFWSTMVPPPADLPVLAHLTPAQKAAKAAKMAGYLAKTPEKVAALVAAALREGVEPARVEAAFAPLLSAVQKALILYRTRKK